MKVTRTEAYPSSPGLPFMNFLDFPAINPNYQGLKHRYKAGLII